MLYHNQCAYAARIMTCFSMSISSLRYSLAAPLNADEPDTTTRQGGGIRATAASTTFASSLYPRLTSANFASEATASSASLEDLGWFGNGTPAPDAITGGVRSAVQCRTPAYVVPKGLDTGPAAPSRHHLVSSGVMRTSSSRKESKTSIGASFI